ncbi:uncharacterized protein LOC107772399 [Nicotiana tabacum]|uniref:Uncharacterized protein n=4 Tax=Nicotiana TaxID=4085 RepID=A0A1S3XGB9_TOBAC|nr:PREDICTED: uncharacterized protein LOC104244465 [Nicotiana sylvestris]XP_016438951.1 PREDICTED: uncharacterized protein LOC107764883 [Nicotiana tabacum]
MGKEAALLSAFHPKKKPMKKHSSNKKKNQLFSKVLDYLKSDSFMFAPLFSSQLSHFPSAESSSFAPTGIEESKPKEGNDKKLVSEIGDYLKSDTYLYSPLVISQPWDSDDIPAETVQVSKGPVPIQEQIVKKRSGDVIKGRTEKVNEPGRKTVNVVRKDQNMDGIPDARSTMVTRTRVRRETVKHMIYQNC